MEKAMNRVCDFFVLLFFQKKVIDNSIKENTFNCAIKPKKKK